MQIPTTPMNKPGTDTALGKQMFPPAAGGRRCCRLGQADRDGPWCCRFFSGP